jgi:hypothetical protein
MDDIALVIPQTASLSLLYKSALRGITLCVFKPFKEAVKNIFN